MTSQEWYAAHPGKKAKHQKRWRIKNPRTAKDSRKERKLYPGMNARGCRNWYKKNRSYQILLQTNRTRGLRAQWKRLNQAAKLKMRKVYERCQWWKKQGFDVVVDHIKPLAKGGKHHPANLQIIYRSENQTKRDKLNFTPSAIFT
jgi:5-methylcytosine-specific restriction endonuclease McrA